MVLRRQADGRQAHEIVIWLACCVVMLAQGPLTLWTWTVPVRVVVPASRKPGVLGARDATGIASL